jgi:hypothetical protein
MAALSQPGPNTNLLRAPAEVPSLQQRGNSLQIAAKEAVIQVKLHVV